MVKVMGGTLVIKRINKAKNEPVEERKIEPVVIPQEKLQNIYEKEMKQQERIKRKGDKSGR